MGTTVLIVDDEAPICDNLAAYLEDEGIKVLVAHSRNACVMLPLLGRL